MAELKTNTGAVQVTITDEAEGEGLVVRSGVLVNEELAVGGGGGSADVGFSGAKAVLTGIFAVADGTATVVDWDAQEYDTDDYWEGVTNPSRFTVSADGEYRITASVYWAFDATAYDREILILKNGTDQLALATGPGTDTFSNAQSVTVDDDAVAGDYYETRVRWWNTGASGDKNLQAVAANNMSVTRLGTTGGQSNLLGEVVLTADAATIDFTNIPATYKDLRLVCKIRTDRATFDLDAIDIQLGTGGTLDTGSNYDWWGVERDDNGSDATQEAQGVSEIRLGGRFVVAGDSAPANVFGSITVDIPGYSNTDGYGSVLSQGGVVSSDVTIGSQRIGQSIGTWRNTGVIDTLRLTSANSANFVAGSTFYLYGEPVLGGGSGIVKGDYLPGDLYLGGQIFENEAAAGRTELYAVGGLGADVDVGAKSLLLRPDATNVEDDHFDLATLDSKWIDYGVTTTIDLATLPGWVGTSSGIALIQAVPGGDWSCETECILKDTGAIGYHSIGLILASGSAQASSTDLRWVFGQNNNLEDYRIHAEKFINGSFSATYQTWALHDPITYRFLKITKVSTTYELLLSETGKTWQRFHSEATLGFTPAYFGLYSSGYFNYFLRT